MVLCRNWSFYNRTHEVSDLCIYVPDDNTQKVASLKDDWQHVDDKMQAFQEDVHSTMSGMRQEMTDQSNDTNRGIDHLKDLMTKLSSDVSVLSEIVYAAWQLTASSTPQMEPPEESIPVPLDVVRPSTPESIISSPTDDFVDIEVPDDASTPEHPTEVAAEPTSPRYSGPFAEVINKILKN